MKIIFSRKGFDSQYGKAESPVFHNGTIISLPLPDWSLKTTITRYDHLSVDGISLGKLVADLTNGKMKSTDPAHLDPDLRKKMLPRLPGWLPMFCKTSVTHLKKHGVGEGDLILFFGSFRNVKTNGGGDYEYADKRTEHVIFGWFQIGRSLPVGKQNRADAPDWARFHPHFYVDRPGELLIAPDELRLRGLRENIPGAGVFERYHEDLVLTAPPPNYNKGYWKLPLAFRPERNESLLSYHDREKWKIKGKDMFLRTADIGQDFVFDADSRPDAVEWAKNLISDNI
jgi:putative DNA base modification enzyme with NMAD domain